MSIIEKKRKAPTKLELDQQTEQQMEQDMEALKKQIAMLETQKDKVNTDAKAKNESVAADEKQNLLERIELYEKVTNIQKKIDELKAIKDELNNRYTAIKVAEAASEAVFVFDQIRMLAEASAAIFNGVQRSGRQASAHSSEVFADAKQNSGTNGASGTSSEQKKRKIGPVEPAVEPDKLGVNAIVKLMRKDNTAIALYKKFRERTSVTDHLNNRRAKAKDTDNTDSWKVKEVADVQPSLIPFVELLAQKFQLFSFHNECALQSGRQNNMSRRMDASVYVLRKGASTRAADDESDDNEADKPQKWTARKSVWTVLACEWKRGMSDGAIKEALAENQRDACGIFRRNITQLGEEMRPAFGVISDGGTLDDSALCVKMMLKWSEKKCKVSSTYSRTSVEDAFFWAYHVVHEAHAKFEKVPSWLEHVAPVWDDVRDRLVSDDNKRDIAKWRLASLLPDSRTDLAIGWLKHEEENVEAVVVKLAGSNVRSRRLAKEADAVKKMAEFGDDSDWSAANEKADEKVNEKVNEIAKMQKEWHTNFVKAFGLDKQKECRLKSKLPSKALFFPDHGRPLYLLADRLATKKRLKVVEQAAEQLAKAIFVLHNVFGFAHMDISPNNIVYRKDADGYKFTIIDNESVGGIGNAFTGVSTRTYGKRTPHCELPEVDNDKWWRDEREPPEKIEKEQDVHALYKTMCALATGVHAMADCTSEWRKEPELWVHIFIDSGLYGSESGLSSESDSCESLK